MKHVLLLTRAMIPSAVLCGHAPLEHLAEQGKIEYRVSRPEKVTGELLCWTELVVFVRGDGAAEVLTAKTARDSGKGLIYVLDDDLLKVPRSLASGEYYAREETRESIRGLMELCSVLASPSPVLREKYGALFAQCVPIEEPALYLSEGAAREDGILRIGFAGSVDRAGDVDAILQGALRRVLEKYPGRVEAEFFGARPALAEELGLRHIPYCEGYEDYARTMNSLCWDIALAPLPETEFHRCKHYNKYVEYAARGIAGVYSDTDIYRRAVRDGENGLLSENTEDAWFASICRLVEDEGLRHRISETCRMEAETVYSLQRAAEDWAGLLDRMEGAQGLSVSPKDFDRQQRRLAQESLLRKLRRHGLRTPIVAAQKLLRRLSAEK